MNQQMCCFNKCNRKGTILELVTNDGLFGFCCVPLGPLEVKCRSPLPTIAFSLRSLSDLFTIQL